MTDNPYAEFVAAFRHDRLSFIKDVLGVTPEQWQAEEAIALDQGCRRISVRSGHGVGKTAWLSWMLAHYATTRMPMKVACTAPSSTQLDDALVPEAKHWFNRLPEALRTMFEMPGNRIYHKGAPEDCFITFRTARAEKPEALQGIHSKHVMLIVDEASGVPEPIFEAAAGSLSTPGAIMIMTGNPTRLTGTFWRSHHRDRENWRTRKVSCFDSTRVDPAYIKSEKDSFGEDSNRYRVRVLGEFPLADEDTVMSRQMVEQAVERPIEKQLYEPIYWGVDVARFGSDKSAVAKRQGMCLLEPVQVKRGMDTMEVAGWLNRMWQDTDYDSRPEGILVDAIGIGAGVADRLIELDLPAIAINVSELPPGGGEGHRLRDQLWLDCRDWFNSRTAAIVYDEDLINELCAPRMKYLSSNGKVQVESKESMDRRGVPSPNRADALCLTFSETGAVLAGLASRRRRPSRHIVQSNWVV